MTVYLGPWEIVGANPRRLLWQCSYAGEVLEHFRTFVSRPVPLHLPGKSPTTETEIQFRLTTPTNYSPTHCMPNIAGSAIRGKWSSTSPS
jgi:hypothetical protein